MDLHTVTTQRYAEQHVKVQYKGGFISYFYLNQQSLSAFQELLKLQKIVCLSGTILRRINTYLVIPRGHRAAYLLTDRPNKG